MERSELLAIFNREMRIGVEYPGARREVDGPVVRYISLTEEDGFVTAPALEGWDVDAIIQVQIDRFARLGQSFEWKVFDYDYPPDLKERLAGRGFAIAEAEALLVLDLSAGPALLSAPVPDSIVKVTGPHEIDAIMEQKAQLGDDIYPGLGERLKRDLETDPDGLSVYLARLDGQVASAAWVYFHHGSHFASLWGGATLPQYRRRGLYTGLLAARAREARDRGFSLLYVDASPMSRPILEKHGFELLGFSYPCVWNAPPAS
jgi:GNAT superfamily N-acetyltransferase